MSERIKLYDQSADRRQDHEEEIRENPQYETELIALTGAKTVPVLVSDGKPMRGSEEISRYLVGKFI
jgi:hypothetical protein